MVGEERDPLYMLTKRKAVYWEQINRIGRRMAKCSNINKPGALKKGKGSNAWGSNG